MTQAERLATFACNARFEQLSPEARQALKTRILDALGCALGALGGEPMRALRRHLRSVGGKRLSTLIGGGKTAPDRAAFFNSALVRYLDFNDSSTSPKAKLATRATTSVRCWLLAIT